MAGDSAEAEPASAVEEEEGDAEAPLLLCIIGGKHDMDGTLRMLINTSSVDGVHVRVVFLSDLLQAYDAMGWALQSIFGSLVLLLVLCYYPYYYYYRAHVIS